MSAFFTKFVEHKHSKPSPLANIRISDRVSASNPATTRPMPATFALSTAELVQVRQALTLPLVDVDDHAFTIPADLVYGGASVVSVPPTTAGSLAWIDRQPKNGATGDRKLTVRYSIPPGGTLRYRVRAYGTAKPAPAPGPTPAPTSPSYEVLYCRDADSLDRLASLMASKKHILFCFDGLDGAKLISTGLFNPGEWKLSAGPGGLPVITINPAWEIVAIIAIIAVMVVSVVTILAIQHIVLKGYEYGYRIHIEQYGSEVSIGGFSVQFSMPTLVLRLEPPAD